jgi:hypothetical protein
LVYLKKHLDLQKELKIIKEWAENPI